MNFEISGTLVDSFDAVQVSDRFRKREFVIETKEENNSMEFKELLKFQLTQDRCDLLDPFQVNDEISVSFRLKGRRWERDGKVSYFTNLEAWRLQRVGNAAPDSQVEERPTPTDDDIPF
ncbi:MAG TPA: DUF3127 domain-containing protein [Verrucomicrobiales bacterium]|jgi:hypothetical protein|nr:DUF3127 domain-containing protein [Verrucomicrobiales bacterium]HIL69461.1 DUF3127 domain-containing protein [Verrucomicrobiota bacterium]